MTKVRKASEAESRAYLRRRQIDYKLTFGNPAGSEVLVDLASFCRANESTFDADPRKAAMLDGRREVWLRIQQHLGLTNEQVFNLFSGIPPQLTEDTNDAYRDDSD